MSFATWGCSPVDKSTLPPFPLLCILTMYFCRDAATWVVWTRLSATTWTATVTRTVFFLRFFCMPFFLPFVSASFIFIVSRVPTPAQRLCCCGVARPSSFFFIYAPLFFFICTLMRHFYNCVAKYESEQQTFFGVCRPMQVCLL